MEPVKIKELLHDIESLPEDKKLLVVSYVRELKGPGRPPAGTPGRDLLKFAGTLDPESADEMKAAIAEDCERVDDSGW